MMLEQMSLARQMEIVFRKVSEELSQLTSGLIFIHIRNNTVGKFGIRHDPIQIKDGKLLQLGATGLSDRHRTAFKQLALDSLKYKQPWTHGEIQYEFALQNNILMTSVQFESHYNMANLIQPAARI